MRIFLCKLHHDNLNYAKCEHEGRVASPDCLTLHVCIAIENLNCSYKKEMELTESKGQQNDDNTAGTAIIGKNQ